MIMNVTVKKVHPGAYHAYCPHLPGCVASGDTQVAAIRGITEAVRGYLAAVSNCVASRMSIRVVVERDSEQLQSSIG
jgi:predicted RNase H-like HicB family nuclease